MVFATASMAEDQQKSVYNAQACPADFYQLPIFPGAKLCQIFDGSVPASLIYHAAADPQTTQTFYQQQLGQADNITQLKGRIMMEYKDSDKIIVISKDGNGSQVDVLIKSV